MLLKTMVAIAIVILSLFIALIIFINNRVAELPPPCYPSQKIPADYQKLLSLPDSCCISDTQNLAFVETMEGCNVRNPISSFLVEDKYFLQVYKMDSPFFNSLKTTIKEYSDDGRYATYSMYELDDNTDMEFSYKLKKPAKPTNIYLDLFGDSTRVLEKNDTLAYYYSKCSYFSIKFTPRGQIDIYGKSKNDFSEIPMNIMFLKHDDQLFLLILSSRHSNTNLNPRMLYDLYFKRSFNSLSNQKSQHTEPLKPKELF